MRLTHAAHCGLPQHCGSLYPSDRADGALREGCTLADAADDHLLSSGSPEGVPESGTILIREVFHNTLFESGITVRHRPNTGRKYGTESGVANDVVTSYVEHAFLTWLLHTHYSVGLAAIP